MTDAMQTEEGDMRAMLEKIKQVEAEKQQLAGERRQLWSDSALQQSMPSKQSESALSRATQEEMLSEIMTTVAPGRGRNHDGGDVGVDLTCGCWLSSTQPEPMFSFSDKTEQGGEEGLQELAKATAPHDSGLCRHVLK